jgi:hypothetical protein
MLRCVFSSNCLQIMTRRRANQITGANESGRCQLAKLTRWASRVAQFRR